MSSCPTPVSIDAIREAKQAKDLKDVLRSSSSFNLNSRLGQINLGAASSREKKERKYSSFDQSIVSDGNREEWCSTVGLLGAGQIFGEICVLNPKIVSTISGVAYTKVVSECLCSTVTVNVHLMLTVLSPTNVVY